MGVLLLLTSLLTPQAPQSVTPPLEIEVTVRGYRPDGTSAAMASGEFSNGESATTWMDPVGCGIGASTGVRMPDLPPSAIAWITSGRITSAAGDDYTVELTVFRGDGTGSLGPRGYPGMNWRRTTKSFVVKRGGSVVLDEIPANSSSCDGRSVKLEVGVNWAPIPNSSRAVGAGALGGSRSAGGGASAGRVGAGRAAPAPPVLAEGSSGAARVNVDPTPEAFIDNEFAHLADQATELSYLAESGQNGSGLRPVLLHGTHVAYRAELWLVYATPDGVERTFTTLGHIDDAGGTFRFNPWPILLSSGPTHALVAANLRPMTTQDGKPVLRVVIARVVQGVSEGASSRAVALPKAGEVVSFELPQGPAVLNGYHFELRVRLTPAG